MKRFYVLLSCSLMLGACANCDDGEKEDVQDRQNRVDSITVDRQ